MIHFAKGNSRYNRVLGRKYNTMCGIVVGVGSETYSVSKTECVKCLMNLIVIKHQEIGKIEDKIKTIEVKNEHTQS